MRIKRILSLLAAAAMTVTSLTGAMTASASEVANGTCGDLTWTLDSDGKLTISGKGAMASPEVYDCPREPVDPQLVDYPDIYTYNQYKKDIKEVIIEEGVTTIGVCAFYKFPNLETVVLPSSVSEYKGIGVMSGGGEPGDKRVDSYVNYAFAECPKLKNLTLAEGMTAIGGFEFYNCTSLESVEIPKSVTNWEQYSFYQCSSLKNISLPEGLTILGAHAFDSTALESVVIPSTINVWYSFITRRDYNYSGTFDNCTKLSSVTFTDGIKTIGPRVFENCSSLKKVTIPASVINLKCTFENCTGLEEAYIEEGTQIPVGSTYSYYGSDFEKAFYNCTNLKRLEIPEGVAIVGWDNPCWGQGCSSLEEVYIHSKSTKAYPIPVNSKIKFYVYNDSSAYKELSKDISTFNKIYDISEAITNAHSVLNKAVNEAKAYTEDKYTAESYGALKTALENAKKYDENYTGVMAMQWAAEDISNAINSLVKKPAQAVKPGTTKPSNDNKITNTKSQAQKNTENAMKQAKITKLTVKSKAKKKITVTWKKVSKANGYQVQVSTNKKFKKSKIILTKTTSKKKITIKKLKSKKTYFVRVRAYATYKDSNGKPQKVYSSWIKKTRKVKVK